MHMQFVTSITSRCRRQSHQNDCCERHPSLPNHACEIECSCKEWSGLNLLCTYLAVLVRIVVVALAPVLFSHCNRQRLRVKFGFRSNQPTISELSGKRRPIIVAAEHSTECVGMVNSRLFTPSCRVHPCTKLDLSPKHVHNTSCVIDR